MQCRIKSLARLLLEAAAAVCLTVSFASAEPSSARQSELRNLVVQDCGSCHGLTLKGGLVKIN